MEERAVQDLCQEAEVEVKQIFILKEKISNDISQFKTSLLNNAGEIFNNASYQSDSQTPV